MRDDKSSPLSAERVEDDDVSGAEIREALWNNIRDLRAGRIGVAEANRRSRAAGKKIAEVRAALRLVRAAGQTKEVTV